MNKSELIAKIAESTSMKKSDTEKFIDAFVANVKEALGNGEKLQIVGFGTFEVKERSEKEGINPATGEKIKIAACKVPAFKPAKIFKEEVNE